VALQRPVDGGACHLEQFGQFLRRVLAGGVQPHQVRLAVPHGDRLEPAPGPEADRELAADHGGEVRRSSSVKDAHARAWRTGFRRLLSSPGALLVLGRKLGAARSAQIFQGR